MIHYGGGTLFASPWDELVPGMQERAKALGLTQEVGDGWLSWTQDGEERVRWVFLHDPSSIEAVRRIYNDDANVRAPVCLIVVRQPDPSETRGDIVFDIFRMSSVSYLWHFNRVYTPPETGAGA
jgi:hypothetical protein